MKHALGSMLFASLLFASCSKNGEPPVDEGYPDANAVFDRGVDDRGVFPPDATTFPDASEPDATMFPDASDPDLGVPDTGEVSTGRTSARPYLIGQSQINHHMPAMFQDIARGFGWDHVYDNQVKNGATLRQQWDDSSPGEGRARDGEDGRPQGSGFIPANAHDALATGDFDILVLTERTRIDDAAQWECTYAYALELYNLAVEHRPDIQVYLFENWRQITLPDWRERIVADRDTFQRFVLDLVHNPPAQPVLFDPQEPGQCPHPNPPTTRQPGRDILLIPVAAAFKVLDEAVEAGTVPGITAREQLFEDDIHANDLGNYFVALVFYATIYRRDPAGATRETIGEWHLTFEVPPEDTASRMEEIAWDVVRNEPLAGVP